MISQVFIVPGVGHSNEEGDYDPGRNHGNIIEADLVAELTRCLEEELELENIRYQTLETRKKPGFKADERHLYVPANSLVLHLRAGWSNKGNTESGYNASTVFYGRSEDLKLAKIISEAVGDWGHCAAYGHQRANPKPDKKDTLLTKLAMPAFRLEPFCINGPGIDDYYRRISLLGRDLGLSLSHWLKERSWAVIRTAKFTAPRKNATP